MAEGEIKSNIKARSISLSATVTRADGTVEDFGVVAYKHRNPIKNFIWHLKNRLKRAR